MTTQHNPEGDDLDAVEDTPAQASSRPVTDASPDSSPPDSSPSDSSPSDSSPPDTSAQEASAPADAAHAAPGQLPPPEVPLSHRLGVIGRLDDALYSVEVVIVVTAVAMMSIMVSTSVLYSRFFELQRQWGEGAGAGYVTIALGALFFGLMGFAAASAKRTERGKPTLSLGKRLGAAAAVVAGVGVVGVAMLHVPSSLIYRLLFVAIMAPVLALFERRGERRRAILAGLGALVMVALMGALPQGYSWAQSYSLFLLLWVGFLGASMAARVRRHLSVDLMRKIVSPERLALFNAVSYLVSATFSGVVCYLGLLYIFGPDSSYLKPIWEPPTWLPASTQELLKVFPVPQDASMLRRALHVLFSPGEPGEPPDWLKVLAIPLSFFLITVRFLGHTIAFARMALAHETFQEGLEVH